MRRFFLVVSVAGLLIAAAPKSDLERFQGTWVLVSVQTNGKQDSKESIKGADRTLIVKGENFTVKKDANQIMVTGSIRLDQTKTPKAYDSTYDDGRRLKGIYQIDGDTLRLCIAAPGIARPTSFETKPGDRLTLSTYERLRPARNSP